MNPKKLPGIIPYPDKLVFTGGSFTLTPDTPILVDTTIEGLGSIVSYLTEKIESSTGFLLHEKALSLQKVRRGIFFTISKGLSFENKSGYEIIIDKNEVSVSAGSNMGLFYGAVTFFQLVCSSFYRNKSQNIKRLKLACIKITDTPRFVWRGLLLDCSRYFMSKEFIKMVIDILALYKMNKFHWHLTDDQGWRIEIKKYPLLTSIGGWRGKGDKRYGGFYTHEDIREIVRYAESRFVEIIPEIEMPGHAVAALAAYPEYSCTGGPFEVETRWGIFDDVLCAGNEKTYEFLYSILDEVCSLFPSQYIHIGGDEVPMTRWSACPKCKRLMEEKRMKKEPELESYLLRKVAEYLKTKGKKTICWDEVTEGDPIKDMTVQYWRSFVSEEILTRALKARHDVIVSPVSHCYLDYPVWKIDTKRIHSLDPFQKELSSEEKSHVLGVECNMWTEHAPEDWVLQKLLPRLMGLAEVGWSGPLRQSFESFQHRLATHTNLFNGMGITIGETLTHDFSNPIKLKLPATFSTTMGIHEQFIPERAFCKESQNGYYCSGRPVKKGESFTLTLVKPHICNYIRVNTMCAEVVDNILENGILESSSDGIRFKELVRFKDGIAETTFEAQKIKAIRITSTEDQESWVVIHDIIVK